MRVVEARGGAGGDREERADRDLDLLAARVSDQGAQGLAIDVLGREEVRAAELADLVDLRDVGMRELGRDAGLGEERLGDRFFFC